MLLNLKRRTTVDHRAAESVGSALHMAISVRLQIAIREAVEPAAEQLLQELDNRLDQVSARRHAVDFELAKALDYWRGARMDELIRRTIRTLAADPELRRIRDRDGVENVVFDHHVETLARASIADRTIPLVRHARVLRENRLNVQ